MCMVCMVCMVVHGVHRAFSDGMMQPGRFVVRPGHLLPKRSPFQDLVLLHLLCIFCASCVSLRPSPPLYICIYVYLYIVYQVRPYPEPRVKVLGIKANPTRHRMTINYPLGRGHVWVVLLLPHSFHISVTIGPSLPSLVH